MSLLPVLNALIPVRRHPIRPHDFALSDPARLPQVCRHPCPRNPRIFPFLSSNWDRTAACMGIPLQETTSTIESVPITDPPYAYLRPSSLPRPRSDSLHDTVYAQSDAILRVYTTSTYVYLSACMRKPILTTIRPRCGRYTIKPNHPSSEVWSVHIIVSFYSEYFCSPRWKLLRRPSLLPGDSTSATSVSQRCKTSS